jgi:hypothetical protein
MGGCQAEFGLCGNDVGTGNGTAASVLTSSAVMSPTGSMMGSLTSTIPTMMQSKNGTAGYNGTAGPTHTDTVTDCECTETMTASSASKGSTKTSTNMPSPYTGAAVPLLGVKTEMMAVGILGAVGAVVLRV